MLYQIEQGIIQLSEEDKEQGVTLAVINRNQMMEQLQQEDRFDRIIKRVLDNDALRFEAHEGLDILCIHLHTDLHKDRQVAIHIFLQKDCLWLVSEHQELLDKQIQNFMQYDIHDWTLEKVFYEVLDKFLDGESARLDTLEDEISVLEDCVITKHGNEDTIRKIIHLRKRLLRQERGYEQMMDVMDHLLYNANQLLEDKLLKGFELMDNRVNRLSGRVHTLQDYVTEIREAYQAEVDISLNITMRVFTVITAVFLPLTLVVGWYGMNLKMPEYEIEFAYPILIIVSILIIVVLLYYFKKHKWF